MLDGARSAGAKVVYTRVAWQPGFADLHANSPLLGVVAQTQVPGGRQPRRGDRRRADPASRATPWSPTSGPAASRTASSTRPCARRAIDTVVFVGVATNLSVEGTARVASDLGYRTVVVSDACSAATPAAHAASLESLGLLAEIITADELLAGFAGRPAAAPQ